MSDRDPFSAGDANGGRSSSVSVSAPPAASPLPAEAPTAATTPTTNVERPCWCGAAVIDGGCTANVDHPLCGCRAAPHADRDGFCANNHPFKGHGGKLSTTHGLHVKQPPLHIDVSSTAARAAVILKVFESTARHAVRLAEAADRNTLRPRDGAALMQALDRLVAIEPQVRALAPSADADGGDDARWDGWPARLAVKFAGEPDAFCEFLQLLLQADRDRVGPLREQVRQVLNHFEPTGVPKWRGHKPDDDDSVLL